MGRIVGMVFNKSAQKPAKDEQAVKTTKAANGTKKAAKKTESKAEVETAEQTAEENVEESAAE